MSFSIERDTDRTGKTTYLLLGGTFDRAAHRDLKRALRDAFARTRQGRVVLDVAGVGEISSECVEVLLTGYTTALRGGYGFEVTNARGSVQLLLEATRLCPRREDDTLYAPAWLSGSPADVS
ncbi:STAS domain-containing protein [Actinoplanes sp. Pm04-4]|uniref:STAS domain-containing protein n=1 Tax=Paractinoplanes pyxinae TaxID=2997416 RepID=A0ABT4B999_9ACTN|nr:STAS domain-containing protein [Actinoplanes pyxinae]MCY1142450.1 STAS domain-containing protein [Actinoplanes pyxinae]